MAVAPGYDAVVLAGGRARRLGGRHKPGLVVRGQPVLQRVCDAVRDADRLVVVGPADAAPERALVTREDPPGSGPVPALAAGLAHVTASRVAVLAADLPFLRERDVGALLESVRAAPGAVLVDGDGREQWLVGVWRVGVLAGALAGYDGSSLRGLLAPLRPVLLPAAVEGERPPPWLDCDTMEDLEAARSAAGGSAPEETAYG